MKLADDCMASGMKDEIAAQEDLPRKRLILFLDDSDSGRLIIFGEDEVHLVELGFGKGSHVYLFLMPVKDENFSQQPGQPGRDASTLNKDGDLLLDSHDSFFTTDFDRQFMAQYSNQDPHREWRNQDCTFSYGHRAKLAV